MLRNPRHTSLLYKSFTNRIYRQGSLVATVKHYSTTSEEKNEGEPVIEANDKHFWEIEAKKRTMETPSTIKSRNEHVARDFRELLEELFSNKKRPMATVSRERPKNKINAVAERQLLELITKERKPYKAKSPLPRSMLSTVYGRSSRMENKGEEEDDDDMDNSIFDFLNPNSTPNWDMEHITSSERIQLKQKEMQSIQAIVESEDDVELLEKVQKEIDQDVYPSYYPKVIVKAIEQAAQKDPYLALTLFEMVKHKSINSYILGCTTQVYNTLLLLRWNAWGDVYGMLDLMEEMTVNGIEFNNESRQIIRDAINEIQSEGDSFSVFWNADEKRYCNIMKELAGKWMITK